MVGIVNDCGLTNLSVRNWIGGVAVPIDLVVTALQEAFDIEYGRTGATPDWPAPRVPDSGTTLTVPDRTVPRKPAPVWYGLALPRIRAAQ
ncbi:hypothetical protein ACQEVZ_55885 [Dactylosporangium sp. CA-152071]|uniref:hypothetical protein n=1 Tax=Dactylosporangium sp. CA-152071 TaxID=3239933 RepID=UPI003D910DBA